MMEEKRLYRMTTEQRHAYVMMLLSNENPERASAFRKECDAYWTEHPDEWEKVRIQDHMPIPL